MQTMTSFQIKNAEECNKIWKYILKPDLQKERNEVDITETVLGKQGRGILTIKKRSNFQVYTLNLSGPLCSTSQTVQKHKIKKFALAYA